MTQDAIEALALERAQVLEVARSLSPDEWAAPSDCAGWRVQDVVAHLGRVGQQLADPKLAPLSDPNDAEASQDALVEEWRDLPPEEVLAGYELWSAKAITKLSALQEPLLADRVVPMGNLGAHPLHLLANATCFDHYCHLRLDILQPSGPVKRVLEAPGDAAVAAAIPWMLAGLPQMCQEALSTLDVAVCLELPGPGGGVWTILPGPVLADGRSPSPAATLKSTTTDFVSWGTHRRSWGALGVRIDGDRDVGAMVAEAVNII